MRKIFLFLIFFLVSQTAHADIIFLKNGQTIEGKVTLVRGIFIRVEPYFGTPFKEFLIENVAYIEQTNPSKASHLAVKNIHQRALNEARDRRLKEAIDQRAATLIEEAIANSEILLPEGASKEMKAVMQQKASALIEEAIKNAEMPRLEETSNEVKSIVREKAGGVIEQAVKDVEVLPLQNAPPSVQIAAKKAATTFIEGAVIDAEKQAFPPEEKEMQIFGVPIPWGKIRSGWEFVLANLNLTYKDYVMGGLMVLFLLMLLREKAENRKKPLEITNETIAASSLRELEKEIEELEKEPVLARKNDPWAEKRKYPRIERDFPVSLILDKVKPISALVKNISLGGAYALCNDIKLLRLGDKCQFKCNLGEENLAYGINGMAEVVRIRSNRGLGLKFFDLDQKSINYLLKI